MDVDDTPLISLKKPRQPKSIKVPPLKATTDAVQSAAANAKQRTVAEQSLSAPVCDRKQVDMKRRRFVEDYSPAQQDRAGTRVYVAAQDPGRAFASPAITTLKPNSVFINQHNVALEDTPSVSSQKIGKSQKTSALTDTPIVRPESIFCAVCSGVDTTLSNPIVLCDGPCGQAFHKSCYHITADLDSPTPWYCKHCESAEQHQTKKQITDPTRASPSMESSNANEVKERRRQALARFVLTEADVDGDVGHEDFEDEENALQIEQDEQAHSSFINDATQLSQHFSQDNLAGIDEEESSCSTNGHRALDTRHLQANQFATPLLNRRMANGPLATGSTSSQNGLGNMYFIRSVLEHHRNGGENDEIEEFYQNMARQNQASGTQNSLPDHWSQ